MEAVFSSKLTFEQTQQLARLVRASRQAIRAMESESAQWQAEGYQGEYSQDEVGELKQALVPFEHLYP